MSWSAAGAKPVEVKLWDPATGRHFVTISGIKGHVEGVAFSADGRALCISEHDVNGEPSNNRVAFWNLYRGPQYAVPGAPSIACDRMAYSPQGRWLATGQVRGQMVTLRDAASCKPIKILSQRWAGIEGLVFSADGHTLAVDSTGLSIWDVRSGRELAVLPNLSWSDRAFSP